MSEMLFDRREPPPIVQFDRLVERALWSHRCIAKGETVFLALGQGCGACGARERR